MTENTKDWILSFDCPAAMRPPQSAVDVAQAIERTFAFPDHGISMQWSGHEITVPYAYGVSDILEDVLGMLEALDTETGEYAFAFTTNEPDGLDADWRLHWDGDRLTVDADWRGAREGIGSALTENPRILVSKREFVASWRTLLAFLLNTMRGVQLEHDEELQRMSGIVGRSNDNE